MITRPKIDAFPVSYAVIKEINVKPPSLFSYGSPLSNLDSSKQQNQRQHILHKQQQSSTSDQAIVIDSAKAFVNNATTTIRTSLGTMTITPTANGASGFNSNVNSNTNLNLPTRDRSVLGRLLRLKQRCERDGAPVRSVAGVLIFHEHNTPHVLLLRFSTSTCFNGSNTGNVASSSKLNPSYVYRLPGGRCRVDEPEYDCLMRKLARKLLGYPGSRAVGIAAAAGFFDGNNSNEMSFLDSSHCGTCANDGIKNSNNNDSGNSVDDELNKNNLFTIKEVQSSTGTSNGAEILLKNSHNNNYVYNGVEVNDSNNLLSSSFYKSYLNASTAAIAGATEVFRISELLSQWYRPTYDRLLYPYCPPHVTAPREVRSLYLVQLRITDVQFLIDRGQQDPNRVAQAAAAAVAFITDPMIGNSNGGIINMVATSVDRIHNNIVYPQIINGLYNCGSISSSATSAAAMVADEPFEIIAVPLFDLHDNAAKYGAEIASLPHVLSRFHINYCTAEE